MLLWKDISRFGPGPANYADITGRSSQNAPLGIPAYSGSALGISQATNPSVYQHRQVRPRIPVCALFQASRACDSDPSHAWPWDTKQYYGRIYVA